VPADELRQPFNNQRFNRFDAGRNGVFKLIVGSPDREASFKGDGRKGLKRMRFKAIRFNQLAGRHHLEEFRNETETVVTEHHPADVKLIILG
jgi:hypothetical protein